MKIHSKPVQRVEYLLSRCENKKVLHLGCTNWPYTEQALGDGSLLHARIAEKSKELFGLDCDERGLRSLRELGFDGLYQADLENLDACELNETFDVVIAGEMIEHLSNPGLFLQGIRRFLNTESSLIITTINAYCIMRYLIYSFRGKRGVNEPVHPDHVAYYSYSTLKLLLERNGVAVDEFLFYDVGTEHRQHNRALLNLANDVAVGLFPQLSDGLIATCSIAE